MAAKKCADLVPLCHPGVALTGVRVEVRLVGGKGRGKEEMGKKEEGNGKEKEVVERASEKEKEVVERASGKEEDEKEEQGKHERNQARSRKKELGIGKYGGVVIEATVECEGKTGVEMEALTAVFGAALSVVDMCKGVDRGCVVKDCRIVRKEGGRSGAWRERWWAVQEEEEGVEGEGKMGVRRVRAKNRRETMENKRKMRLEKRRAEANEVMEKGEGKSEEVEKGERDGMGEGEGEREGIGEGEGEGEGVGEGEGEGEGKEEGEGGEGEGEGEVTGEREREEEGKGEGR